MIPTIKWSGKRILMIDQRKLPNKVEWYTCRSYKDVIRGIKDMIIRGAPAIGVAAAMGLAMGAESIRVKGYEAFFKKFQGIADEMLTARPTAVNLGWAVDRMVSLVARSSAKSTREIKACLKHESNNILEEDIRINRDMGMNGQSLVKDNAIILTHCNAGSLATGGFGTALGVIRAAWEKGKKVRVLADETRPWLQGLRLTSFELMQDHIPVQVITDNAAGYFMRRGEIDMVVTGADRIAANGDVANKIGTYQVAVLAKENKIPFYVAAPLSTIDLKIRTGDEIPVEERDASEINFIGNRMIGPKNVKVLNPAFDITPSKYVSAIITEKGIIRSPYRSSIKKLFNK